MLFFTVALISNVIGLKCSTGLESKVVNGVLAPIIKYPYSAFIVVHKNDRNGDFVCGTSIINQQILLTAAHCFDDCTESEDYFMIAFIGHQDVKDGQIINISAFTVHEKYNNNDIIYDIGLAKLGSALKFSASVGRVALASNTVTSGTAMIAGWGLVDELILKETSKLHETSQRIWNRQACLKIFHRLPVGTFCAGEISSSTYPSMGDSGSALVYDGFLQIGLVSYKVDDISRSLTVYTDTAYHYKWITQTALKLFCY